MKIQRFPRRTRRSAAPFADGHGKRFEFDGDKIMFQNFTAPEIVQIYTAIQGVDAMTARFGDGE